MAATVNTIVLDLGTTAIKAATVTDNHQLGNIFSLPAPPIAIDQGLYTSDAMAYLATVEQLLEKCLQFSRTQPDLGLCYQRSSFLFWDSHTGLPVTPLISWQDNRGAASCKDLQTHNSQIRALTGLPLTGYYLAPKARTMLQQQPELLRGLVNKQLRMGTLDSFLIWHWTTGKYYLTDASMAARTLLMDINTGLWSKTLSEIFTIPLQVLAEIYPSNGFNLPLNNGAVLRASVADQSAALLASIRNDGSEVLVNLGTGGFVIRYQPEYSHTDSSNYLNTLVYQDSDKELYMAVEGTLNSITVALSSYPYADCKIADLAEITDIYCLAEPSGIGAPFFRADIGLEFSQATDQLTRQQIAALLLEAIIFRITLILEDYQRQAEISRVYLSGGLSVSPCIQQGIALCSPAPIFKLLQQHSGLIGVLILTDNLVPACGRQSAPVLMADKHCPLIEKYQRWKHWFSKRLND
ncbi:hypothetical protein AU255_13785 [Methyloprofundus sedimenti]|uniref:Carbohydrate kinase n=1 Tax=Methyloprofundus sedimenti TaxID=1420851 RepID=A0A1V8M3M6_9GAMM|nr:FGGY family carbohydrate kinase [Methyloprofundus sedimenti]OQK16169.1 hypothetical protein AU255_13785 [Methyloprofundus sedimenti]